MARDVWVISDTHFDHQKMYAFLNNDGSKVRPWNTAEEADEIMVDRWNSRVKVSDKVYHLGDVSITKKGLNILDRLNGRKTLIAGNHDIFDTKVYMKFFKNIRAARVLSGMIFSHVPIHPESLGRFGMNVHGHMHGNKLDDPRYLNVCVEQTDYYPIPLEEIIAVNNSHGGG